MAKFILKKQTYRIQVKPERKSIVDGAIFVEPAQIVEAKDGVLITEDPVIIERIRGDYYFNTEEIIEITAEDEEAMKIKNNALKEAEKQIAKLKEGRLNKKTMEEITKVK